MNYPVLQLGALLRNARKTTIIILWQKNSIYPDLASVTRLEPSLPAEPVRRGVACVAGESFCVRSFANEDNTSQLPLQNHRSICNAIWSLHLNEIDAIGISN
ncbi:MAG: hypothetical protein ACI9NN_000880 [Bacteroidia bacterium]|jgi:hypothetical protein